MSRWSLNRRDVFAACAFLLWGMTAQAEAPIYSAPEALAALERGDIVVLDIRTPAEWAETGLAKGAWPVSMHETGFSKNLNEILARYRPEQIAIICATGGRTAYVAEILSKNGVSGIVDISEGMMGNERGPGWIARGLPVSSVEKARQAFEQAVSEK